MAHLRMGAPIRLAQYRNAGAADAAKRNPFPLRYDGSAEVTAGKAAGAWMNIEEPRRDLVNMGDAR